MWGILHCKVSSYKNKVVWRLQRKRVVTNLSHIKKLKICTAKKKLNKDKTKWEYVCYTHERKPISLIYKKYKSFFWKNNLTGNYLNMKG